MATTNFQYGLSGSGPQLQLGKDGNIIASDSGVVSVYQNDGATLAIIRAASPVSPEDVATLQYVQNNMQGLNVKTSVAVATTANVSLSGLTTIDGYSVQSGDRVLVMNQTAQSDNGIYIAVSGSWTRSPDTLTGDSLVLAFTFVSNGTIYGRSGWVVSTPSPITLGTTPIVWTQFSSAGTYTAGAGLTLSGTQFLANTTSTTTGIVGGSIAVVSSGTPGQTLISGSSRISEAVWGSLNLANPASVSNILPVLSGGTGVSSFTTNGIFFGGTGGSSLAMTSPGTVGQVLQANSSGVPVFSTVNLSSVNSVSGVLPMSNGGTGVNNTAIAGGVAYSTSSGITLSAAGTTGQVLTSNGASAPTWNTYITGVSGASNSGTGVGQIFVSNYNGTLGLRNIKSGSSASSVTISGNDIVVDVAQNNIGINNLNGILDVTKGGTGVSSVGAGAILYTTSYNVFGTTLISPLGRSLIAATTQQSAQTVLGIVSGGTPGGSSGQLQYNNAGEFAGAASSAYAASGNLLTLTSLAATDTPLAIVGNSGQTWNLTDWVDSNGNTLSWIDSLGNINTQENIFAYGTNVNNNTSVIGFKETSVAVVFGGYTGTENVGATLALYGNQHSSNVFAQGGAQLLLDTTQGNTKFNISITNNNTLGASLLTADTKGNFVIGNGSLVNSSATDGFIYIPTTSATPTGTPTAFSNATPLVWDNGSLELYAYSNGTWHIAGGGTPSSIVNGTGSITVNSNGTVTIVTADENPALVIDTTGDVGISGNISSANFTGSSSGSNTGDQTITLTGDISGSGTGSFSAVVTKTNGVSFAPSATIDTTNASNITSGSLAINRLPSIATNTVLGNSSGSTASPTAQLLGSTLAFSSSILQTVAMTGDVTSSANSFATTVSKINGVALGSTTASSGNLLIGSGSSWVSEAISGDASLSSSGSLIVTKTNGVSFAPSATTDTTNAANITSGALSVLHGGTGQTTTQAALNTLIGTQHSGYYLRSDGTNTTLSAIQAGDVPTLNQNTTGTAYAATNVVTTGTASGSLYYVPFVTTSSTSVTQGLYTNGNFSFNVSTFAITTAGGFNSPYGFATVGGVVASQYGVGVAGTTSGQVTILSQAIAGTYNFNLPITAGSTGQVLTSQGGLTSAMTWTTLAASATTDTTNASNITSGNLTLARLPSIATNTVLGNSSGSAGTPTAITSSNILDMIGATQGDILYRGASGWAVLTPGNSGQILTSGGASANPSWSAAGGSGTVTSVATNATLTGGTITTTGTLGLNLSNSNTWTAQQNFNANLSVTSGNWLYFNGSSDTNWRIGILDAFTTSHVGAATSIQLVTGQGTAGPDGFAIGQTGGASIFEIVGYTKAAYFTGTLSVAGNLTASGTGNSLGTITSGTWNGSSIGISYGGTGQTTQAAAITALTGTQTSGYYLRSNGSNAVLSAIQAGDVPILNQNTTGTAAIATQLTTTSTAANQNYYLLFGTYNNSSVTNSANTNGNFSYNPYSQTLNISTVATSFTSALVLELNGTTSGTVSIQPQATAGTYTFSLPTTAGSTGTLLTSGGGSAAMTWTSSSGVLDSIGSTQGDILYRSASGWAALAPGTAGYVLTTHGASNNPTWAASGTSLPLVATSSTAVVTNGTSTLLGTDGNGLLYLSYPNGNARYTFDVTYNNPSIVTADNSVMLGADVNYNPYLQAVSGHSDKIISVNTTSNYTQILDNAGNIILTSNGTKPILGGQVVSLAGALTTSGAYSLTLTTTGVTNVTLPTSGTLLTTSQVGTAAGYNTGTSGTTIPLLSGTNTFGGVTTLTGMILAGSTILNVRVVTASGAVTVSATTDYEIIVNKTTGAATVVNLPASPTTGLVFIIKDGKGDAATNNITVTPAAGNIDGSPTYVINTAYAAAAFVYNGTQWNQQ